MSDDLNQRVVAIIEQAIADLMALGADHENACGLLAVQGIVRLPPDADREALRDLLDDADGADVPPRPVLKVVQ